MIKVKPTPLEKVLLIETERFKDRRGFNTEVYNVRDYKAAGIETDFVLQSLSCSVKDTLRGMHGDDKTWKLISCLEGVVYLVVLNYDPHSPQFGQWWGWLLSERNGYQVLVPPLFLNGHAVLSDRAIFHYNWSEYYDGQENQISIRWNDPRFNIHWPVTNPILSPRDGGA
ncbi:MAG: dTDP-4-dehydrorhamnose 3,5-epimerase family protein [bacterium]|nr:dTDP-4-dehydrorhamnose 3,5-epimerase family protein [bacterium]